jgi:amino acid transporter
MPEALSLLASRRPRELGWFRAAGLLFGDWGTSRLYVLGLAFLFAGHSSFWLIAAMSALILAVGWAYTQICRIFPDGGGVYTAGRQFHPLVGVIGALLLFADYTITASLSAVDAFHYFGLGEHPAAVVGQQDAGDQIILEHHDESASNPEKLLRWNSPGLWAIVSIFVIGAFNLMGPKHTAGFAVFAAAGMIAITLLLVFCAIPQLPWGHINAGGWHHPPVLMWQAFVSIVLALSGVEAIANLTGVMKKPVYTTASKAIWIVALEVAAFNMLLALIMVSVNTPRDAHKEDMLAYLAHHFIGVWGEWPVRIIGGLLLLSATNTAVNGLLSILYAMSRDAELPAMMQKLNGFGAPWVAAVIATLVPVSVLLVFQDLERLAQLYAIGIVGAVAINCSLCVFHPRLRKLYRKLPMAMIGVLLLAIWVTLALTKIHALIFVLLVLTIGLSLRQATRYHAKRRPRLSLLRKAIMEQLTPEALGSPKIILATAGSDQLANSAMEEAKAEKAALAVAFIRQVALSYKVEAERGNRFTLDTDPAAQQLFAEFLEHGHRWGVPIIPVYDTGPDAAELIAEHAAINGVSKVLIGSSRRGALHHLIKGSFQRRLETLLPPEIPVEVLPVKEDTQHTPGEQSLQRLQEAPSTQN